jgi:hypothetical protein
MLLRKRRVHQKVVEVSLSFEKNQLVHCGVNLMLMKIKSIPKLQCDPNSENSENPSPF